MALDERGRAGAQPKPHRFDLAGAALSVERHLATNGSTVVVRKSPRRDTGAGAWPGESYPVQRGGSTVVLEEELGGGTPPVKPAAQWTVPAGSVMAEAPHPGRCASPAA